MNIAANCGSLIFILENSPGFGRFGRKNIPNLDIFQDLPNPGIFFTKIEKNTIYRSGVSDFIVSYESPSKNTPLCRKLEKSIRGKKVI